MLLGKMLRGLTGTPMRRMALANGSLAEAEPEPLTWANLMTRSFIAAIGVMPSPLGARGQGSVAGAPARSAFERERSRLCAHAAPQPLTPPPCSRSRRLLALLRRTTAARLRGIEQELLHVPGAGGAALGAEAAV